MNGYENINQFRLSETVSPQTSIVEAPNNKNSSNSGDAKAGYPAA